MTNIIETREIVSIRKNVDMLGEHDVGLICDSGTLPPGQVQIKLLLNSVIFR